MQRHGRLRAIVVAVLLACGVQATVVSTPAVTAQTITIPAQGNYWAGGDSFASGRGSVEPYAYNSASNKCDRSPGSYPPLVAKALGLKLTSFVACAGATTTNVMHGMNGERGQYDSLNGSTALATITVGGNDVKQAEMARRCILPFGSCDQNSAEYKETMSLIKDALPARVDKAFGIMARQAPNAAILVVGYPYLIVPAGTACSNFTDSEKTAVRSVISALNNALKASVQQVNTTSIANGRLTFVNPTATGSPWLGHEMCRSDSFVNALSLTNLDDSFHPNARGQKYGYTELIASYITSTG